MARRFITRRDVEESLDRGVLEIEVDDTVTVTDLAREHALARGVRFVRVSCAAAPTTPGAAAKPDAGDLRPRVRASVVARLGRDPEGLDAVLDRVLARTPGATSVDVPH